MYSETTFHQDAHQSELVFISVVFIIREYDDLALFHTELERAHIRVLLAHAQNSLQVCRGVHHEANVVRVQQTADDLRRDKRADAPRVDQTVHNSVDENCVEHGAQDRPFAQAVANSVLARSD